MTTAATASDRELGSDTQHRRVAQVMGMPISLIVRDRSSDVQVEAAWSRVLGELDRADRIFSTYRPDSAVSRFNRGELGLGDCPAEVHEVVGIAERAKAESDGAFDIWRPRRVGAPVMDPLGVVKGWAVERAAGRLHLPESADWCLSAGGDLICHTADRATRPWTIGIEDPIDPTRLIASLPVWNGAVATSALTHRGDHIIDPRTGGVCRALRSVTVVGPSLTSVDVDATAAFVLGPDAADWLSGRGRTGLVVIHDGAPLLVEPRS